MTLLDAVPLKLTLVPEREPLIVSFTVVFGAVVAVATVAAVVGEVDATDELVEEEPVEEELDDDEGSTVLDELELDEELDEDELLDDEGGVAPVTTTFAYIPSEACDEIVQ